MSDRYVMLLTALGLKTTPEAVSAIKELVAVTIGDDIVTAPMFGPGEAKDELRLCEPQPKDESAA